MTTIAGAVSAALTLLAVLGIVLVAVLSLQQFGVLFPSIAELTPRLSSACWPASSCPR